MLHNIKKIIKKEFLIYYPKLVFYLSKIGNVKFKDSINCEINVILPLGHIDIITIAFNNEILIEKQIDLVRKYVKDKNYTHIIANNSSDIEKRKRIKNICIHKKIAYVSVPQYIHKLIYTRFSNGLSHGAAMNWIYYKLIMKRKPDFFGFIDHDLMPLSDYSILEKLQNQNFYGSMRNREKGWYIWAGFCFYSLDIFNKIRANFLPLQLGNVFLDTGGSNYPVLYKNYDIKSICFPIVIAKSIRNIDDKVKKPLVYHHDMIQIIDNAWLHIVNGSNQKNVKEKDIIIAKVLAFCN